MKLKKNSDSPDAAPVKSTQGGAFLSSRHRNPAEELAEQGTGSDTVGGVCAILATIFLGVATFLLYVQLGA